jgi:hypothetical protein
MSGVGVSIIDCALRHAQLAAGVAPTNIIGTAGAFASASGWTMTGGVGTISGGTAQGGADAVVTTFTRTATIPVVPGGFYKVTVDVLQSNTNVFLSIGGGSTISLTGVASTGTKTGYLVAGATQDVTFTLQSDVDQIDNLVITPVTATLGAERIPDPGFDDPSAWTLGSGWNVSGGVATASGAGSGRSVATVANATDPGTWGLVVFTISSWSGGSISFTGSQNFGTSRAATGTYSEFLFFAAGSPAAVALRTRNPGTTLVVDGLSLKTATFSV